MGLFSKKEKVETQQDQAANIVKTRAFLGEIEDKMKTAENRLMSLLQSDMSGEKVSAADLKKARESHRDLEERHRAGQLGLSSLENRLKTAIQDDFKKQIDINKQEADQLKAEVAAGLPDVVDAYVRAVALDLEVRHNTPSDQIMITLPEEFRLPFKKKLEELRPKEPSLAARRLNLLGANEGLRAALKDLDVDAAYQALIADAETKTER